jgi:hypothetical protein
MSPHFDFLLCDSRLSTKFFPQFSSFCGSVSEEALKMIFHILKMYWSLGPPVSVGLSVELSVLVVKFQFQSPTGPLMVCGNPFGNFGISTTAVLFCFILFSPTSKHGDFADSFCPAK